MAPRPTLTEAQARVYHVVRSWVDRRGYAPTYAQIADALGLSSIGTVGAHIRALEEKGYVRRRGKQGLEVETRLEEAARDVVREAYRVDGIPSSLALMIWNLEHVLEGEETDGED